MAVSRDEHLRWCKDRALEYVKAGDMKAAYGSMLSDMNKHNETKGHPALMLGFMLLNGGQLNTVKDMTDFIEGFN